MEFILLKSSACLLILIAFYKVFLERISNHQFKRVYLISIVLVSIGIPFITFIEYIEPQLIMGDFSAMPWLNDMSAPPEDVPINFLPIILWSIYGLGVLLLSIRFIHNLIHILLKIKRNPKKRASNFINVLLQDLVIPHTFFSYIFLNKDKFENKQIPNEVLLHEETHAKQKHSLDIIFIELLQIIFWFNPLVYILKRDIKLNHEFLADQAVINQGVTTSTYQKILLAYSSHAEHPKLAHAINYSLIKKRFTVMKTKTSKQSLWLRSFLILPLLAILVYGFSTTKQIEKEINPKLLANEAVSKTGIPVLEIQQNPLKFSLNGKETTINNLKKDFNLATKGNVSDLRINVDGGLNMDIIHSIKSELTENLAEIKLSQGGYLVDSSLQQKGATAKQVAEYNKLASYYNNMFRKGGKMQIKQKDIERLKYLYGLMSNSQKENAEPFPDFPKPPPPPPASKVVNVKSIDRNTPPPPPPPVPENATSEEKAKYKKVHEEYNRKYKVKHGHVARKLPPPPPPTPKNVTPEERKKYEAVKAEYEKMKEKEIAMHQRMKERQEHMVERESKLVAREKERELAMKERESRLIHERKAEMTDRKKERELAMKERELIREQRQLALVKERELVREQKELAMKERQLERARLNVPQPPPGPISPLDHVISMAKKGASFYYDGKAISSDEAIKLLKENNKINISSKDSNGKNPTVHLSTKPIKIENKRIPKPTAENIINHIKVMNRHHAKFYLGNTPVTYKEALKFVRKNRNADVRSSSASNVVIISKT